MICDTTLLIDVLRNDASAIRKVRELEQGGILLATTTVSVFELWRGLSGLDKEKVELACEMLDQLKLYILDEKSAKKGGNVAHLLDRVGQEIDPEDAMIAGIAIEHHESVITRNVRHFKRVSGLVVETY